MQNYVTEHVVFIAIGNVKYRYTLKTWNKYT